MNEFDERNTPDEEKIIETQEEIVPIGIARIREEWRAAGLVEKITPAEEKKEEIEPVLFPELDGGAGIGDYLLDIDTVRDQLALSQEAVDRLVASGELDSILLQGPDGVPRRLISESSFNRFREDSAIDTDAVRRIAKSMADKSLVSAIDELKAEIDDYKSTQAKVIQQMKDMLLLEIRNVKEQDRDLTSYVYELTEEIREAFPKKKRR